MLARFYLTTQTFAPAVTLLKEATAKFPQNAECYALLAIAQRRNNNVPGAEEAAATTVRLQPNQAKYWFLQAQILKQSRKNMARPAYERALQLSPNDTQIQAEFADYLARAGDDNAAEKLAKQALQKAPGDLRASGALGLVLANRGDAAAFPLLLKGLQNDRHDILILRTLVRLSAKKADKAEADKWLQEATRVQAAIHKESELNTKLEREPANPIYLKQMAALMGQDGDYLRCMQYHGRAMRQVVDAPRPLLAAAEDLKQGGFFALAKRLAMQSAQNSTTPTERAAAASFLQQLPSP